MYDVTKFVSEHPGGDEVLVTEAARDATEPFEDVGHSEDAYEILKTLYIGDLADPESVPQRGRKPSDTTTASSGGPYVSANQSPGCHLCRRGRRCLPCVPLLLLDSALVSRRV